jgi:hypothetical protein
MPQYQMLIEIHFVYRNNDVNSNLLVNNYFLNVLEDNEHMAKKRRRRKPINEK